MKYILQKVAIAASLLFITNSINAQEPYDVVHYLVGVDVCNEEKCSAINVDIDLLGNHSVLKQYAEAFFFGNNEKGLDKALLNFLASLDCQKEEAYKWNYHEQQRAPQGYYAYILDNNINHLNTAIGFREKWVMSHGYQYIYRMYLLTDISMLSFIPLATHEKTKDYYSELLQQINQKSKKYGEAYKKGIFQSYTILYEKLDRNNSSSNINYTTTEKRFQKFVYNQKNDRVLSIEEILKPEHVKQIQEKSRGESILVEMREKAIIIEQVIKDKTKQIGVFPFKKQDFFTDEFKKLIQSIDAE